MAVDRRTFSLGMVLATITACNTGAEGHARPSDVFWQQYRARFLLPEGRIVDNGNGGISHSESQSYGMLFALGANDREAFDRIANWTRSMLLREDMALHSWRYDPNASHAVSDPNNATDGDIVIAWALALAGERWQNSVYADRSAEIRAAIRQHCVISRYGRNLLLPGIQGFVEQDAVLLNPSYFVWPALDTFARLDGEAAWAAIIADSEDITGLARFGSHQLPTDWLAVTGRDEVAPARGRPPRFGYDAIRVPLFAALGQRISLVPGVEAFWRGCLASSQPIPAWVDVVTGEQADYAVSAGGSAIISRVLGTSAPVLLANDYFAASLQMLARQ